LPLLSTYSLHAALPISLPAGPQRKSRSLPLPPPPVNRAGKILLPPCCPAEPGPWSQIKISGKPPERHLTQPGKTSEGVSREAPLLFRSEEHTSELQSRFDLV